MFSDCDEPIHKTTYGRRKFLVLRSMTKKEIYNSFKNDKYIGPKFKKSLSKAELIVILKRFSGFF